MTGQALATTTGAWSLRRRLTWWIACGACVIVVLGAASVAYLLADSLRRELDSMVHEEVAELEVAMQRVPVDRVGLERIAAALDHEHDRFLISLCVWRGLAADPWLIGGAPVRDAWFDRPTFGSDEGSTGRTMRRSRASIQAVVRDPDGGESRETLRFDLLIDGTPRAEDLLRTGAGFVSLILVAAGLIALGGLLFVSRLARLLERVGQSADVVRLDLSSPLPNFPNAPVEIQRVVASFGESIRGMRDEHSRNLLLTAGLAHELRSPLQNLISEAEITLLREREPDEYKQVIHRQLDDLRELARVVDNLITLTSLRDSAALPRRERFDLGDEAGMRLSTEEAEAERRNVVIELRRSGNTCVDGDREALVLMLRNLVGNAVRWTAADTSVIVTLDGSGEGVVLSVADQGPGIPETDRDAIFEAFRTGRSPKGTRKGYGLGLSLARAAARAHGGEIEVRSASGGGAEFVVRLPREGNGADPWRKGPPAPTERSATG